MKARVAATVIASTSLLDLYNNHFVDFCRKQGDTYVACDETRATHKLVATRWNNPRRPSRNPKKDIREARTRPPARMFALSVLAQPL